MLERLKKEGIELENLNGYKGSNLFKSISSFIMVTATVIIGLVVFGFVLKLALAIGFIFLGVWCIKKMATYIINKFHNISLFSRSKTKSNYTSTKYHKSVEVESVFIDDGIDEKIIDIEFKEV